MSDRDCRLLRPIRNQPAPPPQFLRLGVGRLGEHDAHAAAKKVGKISRDESARKLLNITTAPVRAALLARSVHRAEGVA
jgi:hypothetical protein